MRIVKRIMLSTFLVVASNCLLFGQSSSNENYIRLIYGGPRSDKSIGDVFFSDKKISAELYLSGIFIKVGNKDFKKIKNAIEISKSISQIDISKTGYYKFEVFYNNTTTLFKAINPEKANNMFNEITMQVKKISLKKKIVNVLNIIYNVMINVN